MKNKGDIEISTLIWWLIALFILVILIFGIVYLNTKGISAIDFIKNLIRFKGK